MSVYITGIATLLGCAVGFTAVNLLAPSPWLDNGWKRLLIWEGGAIIGGLIGMALTIPLW